MAGARWTVPRVNLCRRPTLVPVVGGALLSDAHYLHDGPSLVRHVKAMPTRNWLLFIVVGLGLAGLVLVPFHVRVSGIVVKCGAPAIAFSSQDVPGRCRTLADLRLAAVLALAALGVVVAALAGRVARSRAR